MKATLQEHLSAYIDQCALTLIYAPHKGNHMYRATNSRMNPILPAFIKRGAQTVMTSQPEV